MCTSAGVHLVCWCQESVGWMVTEYSDRSTTRSSYLDHRHALRYPQYNQAQTYSLHLHTTASQPQHRILRLPALPRACAEAGYTKGWRVSHDARNCCACVFGTG